MPPAGIVRSAPCAQTRRDEHYDAATVWFHWSTVALVAILWTLGQVTGWLPRSPFRSGLWSNLMGFLLGRGFFIEGLFAGLMYRSFAHAARAGLARYPAAVLDLLARGLSRRIGPPVELH